MTDELKRWKYGYYTEEENNILDLYDCRTGTLDEKTFTTKKEREKFIRSIL